MPIQFRRDTAANWRAANPILASGEPAFETDTQLFKIGVGGASPYMSLPYINTGNTTAIPGGRLSIVQDPDGTANNSSTVGSGILYYCPYTSDKIVLWSGSAWLPYTFSNATALNLGGLNAGKVYDIFAYQSNGTVMLTAVQWLSPVSRSVGLAREAGILVRAGVVAHRYLGTIYTIEGTAAGASQTMDSFSGRYVYNCYNQLERLMFVADYTSHVYQTSSWRPWNNAALTRTGQTPAGIVVGTETAIAIANSSIFRWGYTTVHMMYGRWFATTTSALVAYVGTTDSVLTLSAWDDSIMVGNNVCVGFMTNAATITSLNAANRTIVINGKPSRTNIGLPVLVTGFGTASFAAHNGNTGGFLHMHQTMFQPSYGVGLRTFQIFEYGLAAAGTITSQFNAYNFNAKVLM